MLTVTQILSFTSNKKQKQRNCNHALRQSDCMKVISIFLLWVSTRNSKTMSDPACDNWAKVRKIKFNHVGWFYVKNCHKTITLARVSHAGSRMSNFSVRVEKERMLRTFSLLYECDKDFTNDTCNYRKGNFFICKL